MKRRNFFQSLAAGAAALMLPGGKDVEATHSLVDNGDMGVTGQLEVDGRVGREITWRPAGGDVTGSYEEREPGKCFVGLMSHEAIFTQGEPPLIKGRVLADETVKPGSVVKIQDFGALSFLHNDGLPTGVVKSVSCEINPYTGCRSYYADVIIKS